MFKDAKDLLSFEAFTPSKSDITVPLIERFHQSGPIMGVSISKSCVTCAEIQFSNDDRLRVAVTKVKNFPISCEEQEQCQDRTRSLVGEEEKLKVITSFAKENGLSQILLLYSPGIQIQKVDMRLPKVGIDRLYDTKYAMDEVLDQQEVDRTYAYVGNQIIEEALVFSYPRKEVDYAADFIEDCADLDVVLVTCGIFSIIDHLIYLQKEFISHSQILLICSNDCLFIASVYNNSFQQIGFRANIEIEDIPFYVSRIIERFDYEHTQVSYVNCSDWDMQTYFSQHYPGLKLVPIFSDSFEGIFYAASYVC